MRNAGLFLRNSATQIFLLLSKIFYVFIFIFFFIQKMCVAIFKCTSCFTFALFSLAIFHGKRLKFFKTLCGKRFSNFFIHVKQFLAVSRCVVGVCFAMKRQRRAFAPFSSLLISGVSVTAITKALDLFMRGLCVTI